MYRTALRSAARPLLRPAVRSMTRRWASTASPADRPRTWRSSALRWGIAVGAVYYYNTAPAFMDSDALEARRQVEAPSSFDDADLPTVDSVLEEKRQQIQSKLDARASPSPKETTSANVSPTTAAVEGGGSPQALEDEAGAQGAFNPETGEINWDCPCLGGMATGPCGEEFKTAFSCFVYSEEDPKGMDCIDKFQGMQECFKKYPEIYGAELADDEDGDAPAAAADGDDEPGAAPASNGALAKQTPTPDHSSSSSLKETTPATPPIENREESAVPDGQSKLPKWEDATAANQEKEMESKK